MSPYNQYVADEKNGKHVLPYSVNRVEPEISYNLMMMPSKIPKGPENPFGAEIPINYFCVYEFDIDWTQIYMLDIMRFYSLQKTYQMETVDLILQGPSTGDD